MISPFSWNILIIIVDKKSYLCFILVSTTISPNVHKKTAVERIYEANKNLGEFGLGCRSDSIEGLTFLDKDQSKNASRAILLFYIVSFHYLSSCQKDLKIFTPL